MMDEPVEDDWSRIPFPTVNLTPEIYTAGNLQESRAQGHGGSTLKIKNKIFCLIYGGGGWVWRDEEEGVMNKEPGRSSHTWGLSIP